LVKLYNPIILVNHASKP